MAPGLTSNEEVYDYIVCGGGTSGSVVAGRLAEDRNLTVLVIEAGADNADLENTQMAGGWSQNFDSPQDWNLVSTPNDGMNGRQIKNSRGRFLGGSSGVNGTLCIRGTKQDYDDWGLKGWSGEEMFRCMAKAETFHGKQWFDADKKEHGYNGPLHVEPHDLAPISNRVMQSYVDLGMPFDPDMFTTGGTPHGSGHAPRTVHQGIRTTGADFITKTYRRDNITIKCDTTVDRVLFNKGNGNEAPQATGVALVDNSSGEKYTVRVRKEVILSGGSYCTPPILLRSGIGPKDELAKHSIDCLVDSPGVGKNLMDHLIVFIFYEVAKTDEPLTTDHHVYNDGAFATTYQLWKEKKTGFLSTFPFGAFAFARVDDALAEEPAWKNAKRAPGRDPMGLTDKQPNIEFFHTECYGGPKQFTDFPKHGESAFAMIPELFSPRSRGSVTIASKDPMENPVIDHRYLSDPEGLDLLVLTEACRLGNDVVVNGKGTKDIVTGSWPTNLKHHSYKTRKDWVEYVKDNATTCYHPGGTAKMGVDSDKTAVCDETLKVRGTKGLRVCDVSVMPLLNQGHTQMPAYGIGERGAEIIRSGQ